jgi:hypothetical protein
MAGTEEEIDCTLDQSVLTTICRNFRKGGILCALHIAVNA